MRVYGAVAAVFQLAAYYQQLMGRLCMNRTQETSVVSGVNHIYLCIVCAKRWIQSEALILVVLSAFAIRTYVFIPR